MALTTQQLLYINNLLYTDTPSIFGDNPQTSYKGRTLGELVTALDPSKQGGDGLITEKEWTLIRDQVLKDNELSSLVIVDSYKEAGTGNKGCVLCDPFTNEAIVAFAGTGNGEWKDNFQAGTYTDNGQGDNTISVQQQKAIDYVNSLDLSQYDSVTVTGHSKGGNKAKICALLCDDVDRCVSFDGQGFSDEFMEAHRDDIAQNQHKIQNHNVDADYVNILLNDVGETTYYKGQRTDGDFLKNHCPAAFLTNDGQMEVGEQDATMKEMDQFVQSLLRSVDPKKKADLLECYGEIADALFRGGSDEETLERVKKILLDPRYADELSYTLAYAAKYFIDKGQNALSDMLRKMGLGGLANLLNGLIDVMSNDFIFSLLTSGATGLAMAIKFILERFGVDIPLSYDEIQQLGKLLRKAGNQIDDIKLKKNSGKDIKVKDAPSAARADVIAVSVDQVENCAHQLRSLRNRVADAANILSAVSTDPRAGGDLKSSFTISLSGGIHISGVTVADQVAKYRKTIAGMEDDMARLADRILQVAGMFESTENSLRGGAAGSGNGG